MINIDDKTRRLSQATIVVGYKQENKAESIEFEIPDYLKEYGKKICFKTKDGKVFSKLFDNTTSNIFTFTRTETQYGELDATIQFFKAEDEDIIIYKTSMLHIIFKDAVICEDEIQPDDPKYPILEDLIIKVSNITKDITTINKNIEDIDKKNNEQDTKIQTNKTDIADIKKVNIKQDNNIKELQTENEQLKNQIPNGQASGNAIHIEDSSDLELKWGLNGGHKQEIGENSPSPEYPSEIETVNGSVKIDVVNNNLSDFNVTQDGKVKVNEDGTITINGNGGFALKFRKFIVKANTKYYLRWELISGTVSGINIFMNPILKKGWIKKDTFVESSVTEDSEISDFWINEGAVFSNAKIKIWISKSQNDFTKHQSQTVTMPVQQEMLEGDYIDDVEHHEWGKIILTGEEDWTANWQNNDQKNSKAFTLPVSFFGNKIPNYDESALKNNLSSHFSEIFSTVWSKDIDSVAINISPVYSFQIRLTKETLKYNDNVTNNELKVLFQSWLKSQYDAGTPVIVYYKLATPFDLELTTEQKAIREQKLHTYKNVTNISLSNDLSSAYVSYKKDLETIFNNLQSSLIADIEKPK